MSYFIMSQHFAAHKNEERTMKTRKMNILVMVSFAVTLLAWLPHASAWTRHLDFNSGTLGSKAEIGGDSFDGAAGGSSYDAGEVYEGNSSARLSVTGGETAFGVWGGIINHPSDLVRGDEVWFRVRTFMPAGFNYDSYAEGSHLKFLRIHTQSASGANQGYNDWYINPTTRGEYAHKFIFEGQQQWSKFGDSATQRPVLGVWETYELYLKLDPTPVDSGGEARVKVWKNGILLGDFTNRYTLVDNDSVSDRTHIFTYWNGGAPKTQHMWLDDVILTTDTPSAVDAEGNRYIGMGDVTPRPNPPGFVNVRLN